MKTFYKRTLTAIIFVIIMLGGMLWSTVSFTILFLCIAILGLLEYFKLIKKVHKEYEKVSVFQKIVVCLLIPAGFLIASKSHFFIFDQPASFLGIQALAFLLMLLLITSVFTKKTDTALKNLGYSLLGTLYVGIPFSLMITLKWEFTFEGVPLVPLIMLFSLWINDTFAYLIGSFIGKTPFAPKISPKKTWEGTLGGMLLTLIAAGIYGYFSAYFSTGIWIALAGVTAVFGTIGDLLESVLKRKAKVKDSGNLLPGHGGILDRFDSMILAIPFVWILLLLV